MHALWQWAIGDSNARWRIPPLLALLLIIALALRLYGISWDQGHFFHADERSIYMRVDCMYRVLTKADSFTDCTRDAPFQQTQPGFPSPTVFLDADKSALNPHWFPLGTLIIYALLAIKFALAPIVTLDLQGLSTVGRTLTALADVATIAVAYALAKRMFGRGAGLLTAALITFAVIHIQIAHFYRPEPFYNLFLLCSFWQMLNVLERGRLGDSAKLGLFVGLTFAMKASALPLLLPVAVVYVYLYVKLPRGGRPSPQPSPRGEEDAGGASLAPLRGSSLIKGAEGTHERTRAIEGWALRCLMAGAVAAAVYLVTTPYALLGFPEFLEWNLREVDVVRRAGIGPYTLQYTGAPKLLYELQQSIVWGLGVPLGLLAWAVFLAALVRNFWRPKLPQVLLLLWAVPLLFTIAGVQVKFLRYTFPLMPVFIILASGLAVQAVAWAGRRRPLLGKALAAGVGLIVAATAFYGLAFMSIYAHDHTAVQASKWIRANIPPGTEILQDNHWDEGIPDLYSYEITQLPMFEGDSVQKMQETAQKLARAETLVFYSNRTYGAIARVPERYPYSSAYYNALFKGDLGYELAAGFSSYPTLLGVAFVDDPFTRAGLPAPEGLPQSRTSGLSLSLGYADNDAITYDHPLALVFRNTAHYDSSEILQRLLQTKPATSAASAKPTLLLTDQERQEQQSGGTWTSIYDPSSIANHLPVLAWLLLVETAFLAAWPLAYVLFRGLHDRGYLLTKAFAILLLAYIPWMLAALKLLPFTRWTVFFGLALIAAAGAVIVLRKREEMSDFLRQRWKGLVLQEVLFLAAFLAFVAIRWANPDLWHPYRGGEKPMDFAYLNAVVRSTTVPPYDPWFAGGYLNYYYFGQFIVATLIKLTGILPEVAYNLAVPLMFALTVAGAFSVAYNLAHALREATPLRKGPLWVPAAAGVTAALFVAVLGNMGSAAILIANFWKVAHGAAFPAFDFWAPSRMMPGQISITEFPFWTFLFSDLHAHLIAIPFGLLAIGLALNVVGAYRRTYGQGEERTYGQTDIGANGQPLPKPSPKGDDWLARAGDALVMALPVAGLALSVGALAAINTWDYPTYLLLGAAVICLGWYGLRRRFDRGTLARAAVWAGAFAVLSYALYLPYHQRNSSVGIGVQSSLFQTNIFHYIGVHALFLLIVISFLLYESRGSIKATFRPLRRLGWRSTESAAAKTPGSSGLAWALAVALGLMLLYILAAGYGTAAFLFLLLALTVVLAMHHLAGKADDAPHQVFLLALLVGALGIGIGVDLVTVQPDIDRMNTVFKFYLEGWALFGVASAVMLWRLLTAPVRPMYLEAHTEGADGQRQSLWRFNLGTLLRGMWLGVLGLLLIAAAIFPVLGTRSRLADRFSTAFQSLNGAQFMQTAVYRDGNFPLELGYDWDGIQWLRANVQGSPVIAEGSTDPHNYRWGGRISIYTGLPSIVGWGWHQEQQRVGHEEDVRQRLSQVRTLYTTTDAARAVDILRVYHVQYVYVGQLERLYYPAEGLAKFDGMTDAGVKLVYQNPQVKIYQVG